MRYTYYITDLDMGEITGTNDEAVARSLAECEDYFVVNAEMGYWLLPKKESQEVKEYTA